VSPRLRTPIRVLPVAVFLVCLMVGTASAIPEWIPDKQVQPETAGSNDAPRAALDARGDALLTFRRVSDSALMARTRFAGKSWAEHRITTPVTGWVADMGPNGHAAVLFPHYDPDQHNYRLQIVVRPPAGPWSSPITASPIITGTFRGYDVAVDGKGRVYLVWAQPALNGNYLIKARVRTGHTWSSITTFTTDAVDSSASSIEVNAAGDAIVAFNEATLGQDMKSSFRPRGSSWGPLKPIGTTTTGVPLVGIDDRGIQTVAFVAESSPGVFSVFSERRAPGVNTNWSSPQTISGPGNAHDAGLVVSPRGAARAIWFDADGLQTAGMSPNGSWGSIATMRGPGSGLIPGVALGNAGVAFVTWLETAPTTPYARVKRGSHAFSSAEQIGATKFHSGVPSLDADARGDALFVWSYCTYENLGSPGTYSGCGVRYVAYDCSCPVFTHIGIPRRGRRGRRIDFSIASFDQWSGPPRAASWNFGDGTSAHGNHVSHRYRHGGTYTVRVRQLDTRGNATTVRRRIRIRS